MNLVRRIAMAGCLAALLSSCRGAPPVDPGDLERGLPPCPSTPNCVHTGDRHPEGTRSLRLAGSWLDAPDDRLLAAIDEAVAALPRTRVVATEVGPGLYLRAESTSRLFRFVDDLEVHRARSAGELVVRSASRVGRSDRGVNAGRVAELRQLLEARGVIRPE
jgi:uncharacterized protein (DUF1499 family)